MDQRASGLLHRPRFFPLFFLSPSLFPVQGQDGERNTNIYSSHRCQEGDTLYSLARTYNVPQPILEAMNTHLPAANPITPGSIVHIPRMDTMVCQKVYWEQPVPVSYSYPTIPKIGPRYNRPSASYNGFYSC